MSSGSITRADLVNNFPVRFTCAALRSHFSSEYYKVVGHHAEAVVIATLVKTFKLVWKVVRSKGSLYSTARGKEWLQTKLAIKEPAPEIHEVKATVGSSPSQWGVGVRGVVGEERKRPTLFWSFLALFQHPSLIYLQKQALPDIQRKEIPELGNR